MHFQVRSPVVVPVVHDCAATGAMGTQPSNRPRVRVQKHPHSSTHACPSSLCQGTLPVLRARVDQSAQKTPREFATYEGQTESLHHSNILQVFTAEIILNTQIPTIRFVVLNSFIVTLFRQHVDVMILTLCVLTRAHYILHTPPHTFNA
jgi:hypothetical protein